MSGESTPGDILVVFFSIIMGSGFHMAGFIATRCHFTYARSLSGQVLWVLAKPRRLCLISPNLRELVLFYLT
jgi:hypothetical protein